MHPPRAAFREEKSPQLDGCLINLQLTGVLPVLVLQQQKSNIFPEFWANLRWLETHPVGIGINGIVYVHQLRISILVGGLEHFYFPIYWE